VISVDSVLVITTNSSSITAEIDQSLVPTGVEMVSNAVHFIRNIRPYLPFNGKLGSPVDATAACIRPSEKVDFAGEKVIYKS